MPTLIAKPHPLRSDAYRTEVPAGVSLRSILGDVQGTVHAQVDGDPWPLERWDEPLPEGLINVYMTPQDDAIRVVTLIAVSLAAPMLAPALTAGLGLGTSALAVGSVAAGLTLAGSLAVNALIPPKMPSMGSNTVSNGTVAQSITGTRNQANPYGVIPRVYGSPRWYPPLAGNPYTEIAGNDQYLRMMVCLGYGPLEINGHRVGPGYNPITNVEVGDKIRIGDTPIGLYQDVQWEAGLPHQLSIYTRDIDEQSVNAALDLQNRETGKRDLFSVDNVSAIRTTAPNTTEISIDIVWPQGLYTMGEKNGDRYDADVTIRMEYRTANIGSWALYTEGIVRSKSNRTLRKNWRWSVPAGQYDVRITRVKTYSYERNVIVTDAQWSTLRSIQGGAPAYSGNHVLMALRIRATDQLNGVIDQLNVKTTAVLRHWNGSSFASVGTNNPAWAYLNALTGQQVGRPIADNKIDLDGLREWAIWCDQQGLEYSWVHDSKETLFDRARNIAAAGQASFSLQDGRFGVVRDDANAPVVQVISPRNASGFESTRQYKALPHAIRVKYIEPSTWSDSERIIYRNGYSPANATTFEDFETQGVVGAAQAWHHGQYYLRQAILRPETFTAQMDWEHLAVVRGNRVRVAYDSILVGQAWARIKMISIDGFILTLDERVLMQSGVNYGARVRCSNGEQVTAQVVPFTSGETNVITLTNAISPNVDAGDLLLFGELGKESIDCKVTRIEPGADFTATVTLVDAAIDIYNYGVPPAYNPGITQPVSIEQIKPAPPIITGLISDGSTLSLRSDGTFAPGVLVAWQTLSGALSVDQLEVRHTSDGGDTWERQEMSSNRTSIRIETPQSGVQTSVQMRARSVYGTWSNWSGSSFITPVGEEGRPGNVTGFTLAAVGDQANLAWDAATDIDVTHGGHIQIYHAPALDASLSSAIPVARFSGSATEGSVPLLAGTYFAVFQDAGGRTSPLPTRITTTAPRINKLNVAETLSQGPAFDGIKSGVASVSGGLKLDSINLIDDQLIDIDSWGAIDTIGGVTDSGSYLLDDVIDLGAVYTSRLTAAITASTYVTSELIDNRQAVDAWLDVDGITELVGPQAKLFVRSTNDNPSASPAWSDWEPFTVGDYSARAFDFRLDLSVDEPEHQIEISQLSITIDMPDRVEADNDVPIPAAGLTILFVAPFWATPAIGITAESLSSGERVIYSKTTEGFTVQILDSAGNGVARTIDWIAKSYGYQEAA